MYVCMFHLGIRVSLCLSLPCYHTFSFDRMEVCCLKLLIELQTSPNRNLCSQLEVVGPGGSPDGYGDDDHQH